MCDRKLDNTRYYMPLVAVAESHEPAIESSESPVESCEPLAVVESDELFVAESPEPLVAVVESPEPLVAAVESPEPLVAAVESPEPLVAAVESSELKNVSKNHPRS
ncbi:uncharacterized protein LOC118766545 [Octopus sinensis]|uniref:Uncharacterized protein LOC118766545 n=1 Tax=Octopus sinensis TaxID=2607531 RepID=A0A7E6FG39_9MOLL|nr:uncharacterized protein LOC118766545 [Octopus sinensis]